ncbi:hypothetical protein L484_023267 [Morus notabilis]|uniref:Uncharacterized protein n=1 Tax=Morus notabilis TaxID=981085 RepID=W9RWB4_9ROSA|nr:hypothetical protein L484_023267 [Morus notabilis]
MEKLANGNKQFFLNHQQKPWRKNGQVGDDATADGPHSSLSSSHTTLKAPQPWRLTTHNPLFALLATAASFCF